MALCLLAGASFAAEPCLQRDQIDGVVGAAFHDSTSVVLRDRDGRLFLMRFSGWCHDLNFKTAEVSTTSCLKSGDWFTTYGEPAKYTLGDVGKKTGLRCIIKSIEPYRPDQAGPQGKD